MGDETREERGKEKAPIMLAFHGKCINSGLPNCSIIGRSIIVIGVSGGQKGKREKSRMGKAGKEELTLQKAPLPVLLYYKVSPRCRYAREWSRWEAVVEAYPIMYGPLYAVKRLQEARRKNHLLSESPAPIAGFSTCDCAYTKRRVFFLSFLLPSFFLFFFFLSFSLPL